MEPLSFIEIIITLLVIITSIIAVKFAITFDFNKYLERKDEMLINKIQNTCSHVEFSVRDNDQILCKNLFVSPSGTRKWQCERCKLITDCVDYYVNDRIVKKYVENYKEYGKQQKKFYNLLKKGGFIVK